MIIDKTENHDLYHFGPVWKRVFAFLETLTPDSPEQRYAIQDDDIFAIVMSYDTCAPESGLYESHREYVDVQSVIVGCEGFECAFADTLDVETLYDAAKDAAFYRRSRPGPSRVDVSPGTFVMLYPNDAHMAGLIVGDSSARVKKVVVKIRKSLLAEPL
jgi:YhcH/YjgK/YiaL family protein